MRREGTNLRKLRDLLQSIPTEAGRAEVLTLARRAHEDDRLLDELIEKIRWFLRAARYAVPAPQELREMINEHFRDEPKA